MGETRAKKNIETKTWPNRAGKGERGSAEQKLRRICSGLASFLAGRGLTGAQMLSENLRNRWLIGLLAHQEKVKASFRASTLQQQTTYVRLRHNLCPLGICIHACVHATSFLPPTGLKKQRKLFSGGAEHQTRPNLLGGYGVFEVGPLQEEGQEVQ